MSMSTRKVEPDPGALERQHERQRDRTWGKTIGVCAVVAAIGLASVASSIVGALGGQNASTPAERTPTVARGTGSGPFLKEDRTTGATLSPEQKIERIGNKWALLFASGRDRAACQYQTQPLCERIACERVGGFRLRNCTPPSLEFRRSFRDATVQDVAIKGDLAAARFSNGEAIELFDDVRGAGLGDAWWIGKVGGNAGRRLRVTNVSEGAAVMLDARPEGKACGSVRIAPAGEYPLLLVEVVQGNVSCREARRVTKDHYLIGDAGSWSCHGPEGLAGCEKPSGETIRARFYCRDWETERARCLNTFGPP
jgi:hypothetical protein